MAPLAPRRTAAVGGRPRDPAGRRPSRLVAAALAERRRGRSRWRSRSTARSRDVLRAVPRGAGLRRGRRPQGRRVRRDPGPARSGSARARVFDTLLDEQTDPRPRARRGRQPGCCRSRRSSTWPTCTTPRTRSAARPRRCSSSPTASTATRWWCASPATATRRASAATSTTTTRSRVLRDIPGLVVASPARPDDAAAMLRTCVAAAQVDGTVCVFLEPIALYHARDLHEPGTTAGWRRTPARALGRDARADRPGADLRRRPRPDHRHLRQRRPHEPAGRRAGSRERGIDARVLDLRWLAPLPVDGPAARGRARPGGCWSSTRPAARGGVSEGVVTALVDARLRPARIAPGHQRGQLRPARRRGAPGAAVRGAPSRTPRARSSRG